MDNQQVNQSQESILRKAKAFEQLLEWQHQTDFKGLLAIYPKDKLLKGIVLPSIITIVILAIVLVTQSDIVSILTEVTNSSISALPSLLGFLLGGYTILIGFGDKELLKTNTTIVPGRSISLFQILSVIFVLTIYAQVITLALALIIHFTLSLDVSRYSRIKYVSTLFYVFNIASLSIILFLLLYSVLALRDIVMNVFGFAQQYHLTLTKQRMQDDFDMRKKSANK